MSMLGERLRRWPSIEPALACAADSRYDVISPDDLLNARGHCELTPIEGFVTRARGFVTASLPDYVQL